MGEQPPSSSKRSRAAYARLICLGCHERRIKCELPDEIVVPDPGELHINQTPCYRCKRLGVPCVVRRTRLGRPGPEDGTTTLAAAIQDEVPPVSSCAINVSQSQGGHWNDAVIPIPQPGSRSLPIPHYVNPAKVQILPLRRPALPPRETSSSSDDRQITAKRTRASKPKVRTGCLTCKIRRVCNLVQHIVASLTLSSDQMRRSQTCLSEMQHYRAQM